MLMVIFFMLKVCNMIELTLSWCFVVGVLSVSVIFHNYLHFSLKIISFFLTSCFHFMIVLLVSLDHLFNQHSLKLVKENLNQCQYLSCPNLLDHQVNLLENFLLEIVINYHYFLLFNQLTYFKINKKNILTY